MGSRKNFVRNLSIRTNYSPNLVSSMFSWVCLQGYKPPFSFRHEGMSDLLPNTEPYYFRFNSKLTFNFGKPIDLKKTMQMIFDKNIDEVEARRLITEEIQKKLEDLREETELLHKKS